MSRATLVAFLTLLVVSLPVRAQPLAERVPADAVVYVGWAGAESMGPGFEGSHLKALLDSAEVGRIVREVVPALSRRAAQEEPGAGQAAAAMSGVLGPMWRHPTAFYVGPVDMTNPQQPMPRAALICDAGEDAAGLQRQLDGLVKGAAGNSPVPIGVRRAGNLVAVVVGKAPELDAVLAGKGKGKTIQTVKSFAAAMAAQKSPVLAGYVDAEAIVHFIDKMAADGDDEDMRREWPAARDALGLAGLKRVSFAAGFDGPDWGTHAFIEAPAPRTGLLAMLDAEPVGDDALRAIPASATMAGVFRLDLGGIFDAIREAAGKIEEGAAAQMDEGVQQVNAALSMDLRQDVLGPLGDEWSYYVAPELTGRGPFGLVLVNRLRDAEKAQAALEKLREMANGVMAQQMPPDAKLSFKQTTVGDTTIHYLASPFVTPSWAVQNGNLYVGLYPQIVAAAAGHVSREGKSILDNEAFTALRKRLGNHKATAYQFYDLPRSAPTSYQIWLIAASFGKVGDMFGVDTPPMLLPPLQTLIQHLSVAGAVTWTDAQGWHYRGVTPFPGGTAIASETAGMMDVQTSAILVGLLLPSLNRAREQANRVKSASNLRQIGQAAQIYAAENRGKLPPDLATTYDLVKNVDVYLNPNSATQKPQGLKGDELKAWINESADYVYLGAGKDVRGRADTVLAHERPETASGGLNILFLDGHVEWQAMPQAMETIKRGGQAEPGQGDGL